MWSKYLSNNVWRDFDIQCRHQNANLMFSGKIFFAVNLLLKVFHAAIANVDIGRLKSLHKLFDKYLGRIGVKFEENRMVQTTQNFELLTKK